MNYEHVGSIEEVHAAQRRRIIEREVVRRDAIEARKERYARDWKAAQMQCSDSSPHAEFYRKARQKLYGSDTFSRLFNWAAGWHK